MPSWELNKSQIAKLGLAEAVRNKEVLSGLAEIAAYTGLSIKTIRRAIDRNGLIAGHNGKSGKYISTKQNIDIWIASRHLDQVEKRNSDKWPFGNKMRMIASKLKDFGVS